MIPSDVVGIIAEAVVAWITIRRLIAIPDFSAGA
jgi:hypothetical protein